MCSGKEYRFVFPSREAGLKVSDALMDHRHGWTEFTLGTVSYNINRAHVVGLEIEFKEQ
jgi:hypothetical protein